MKERRLSLKVMGFIFVFLGLLTSLAALPQQSADELYEAAVFKKDADGDLEGAIKLFKEILERFPENKQIAAKAQLNIGLCYEKLGQRSFSEAQQAFQKVLENYPKQTDAVKLARQRLSRITQEQSLALKSSELSIRKIGTSRMMDDQAHVSPNGRFISFVDWGTGDLAVYNIETKKKRSLTNKGSWKTSPDFALNTVWSPDSKNIGFVWSGEKSYDLRIIGIDSKVSKVLHTSPGWEASDQGDRAQCRDWSPDGKRILVRLKRSDKSIEIATISIANGSIITIKSMATSTSLDVGNMRYSPDGRHIAYDSPKRLGSTKRDIFLISSDGKNEIKLTEHPSDDRLIDFMPDGKHILFSSDRNGTWDIWAVAIDKNGKPEEPALVKANMGAIASLGVTQSGAFCYVNLVSFFNVFSAEIDVSNGKLVSKPEKLVKHHEGMNDWPEYSPDGKYMVYLSKRNISEAKRTPRATGSVVCIYSLDTGKMEEIPTSLDPTGPPCWSPDGNQILITGGYEDGNWGLYSLDVKTGEAVPLIINDSIGMSYEWSHDGESIFYVLRNEAENFSEIIERNLQSGKERTIHHEDEALSFSISCSSDGKWLAMLDNYRKKRQLNIVPLSGGDPRVIYSLEQKTGHYLSHAWSVDNRHVILTNNIPPEQRGRTKRLRNAWDSGHGCCIAFPLMGESLRRLTWACICSADTNSILMDDTSLLDHLALLGI